MIWALALALSIPLFIGFFSILSFFFLEVFNINSFIALLGVLVVLCPILLYAMKRKALYFPWPAISKSETNKLVAVFLIALGAAVLAFVLISLRLPNGGWDAWAIWNMRARFILRSGEHWHDAFSPLLGWNAHPDYPLLLPLSVESGWKAVGQETPAVPVLMASIYCFATVALLWSSIALLRGSKQGLLAGLALLGTPFFITQGAAQCADVPIGLYFLATLVLYTLYDRDSGAHSWLIILAGLAAGFAAWTKNEGILFCLVAVIARLLANIPARGVKTALYETALFFCGLAVPLATVLFFKIHIAPPGDLYNAQTLSSLIGKLGQVTRYTLILKAYLLTGMKFTAGGVGPPLLLVYALLMGKNGEGIQSSSLRTGIYTLILMLAGYVFVYVTTPYDLQWHLDTSLTRLFLQLWPGCLFWFFLQVRGLGREARDDLILERL